MVSDTATRPLFYRGDLDDQVVTADNGARVNSAYNHFIRDGSWGRVSWSQVCPGVHAITGLGFNNHVFIESDNGLILFDTGTNIGTGEEILKLKAQFSDKPVVAIIYSHHHYTQAAKPIIEAYPERDIPIYSHPDLEQNLLDFKAGAGSAVMRRAQMQTGMYLPSHGEDAALMYGFSTPRFVAPESSGLGHVSPTCLVEDGEEIAIDGRQVVFYHASADATDSLIVYFPELELITHNAAIMPMMFPLYTLRGEKYRVTEDLISGIDRIRSLRPAYMVGCHGHPVVGVEKIYQVATAHRDTYAYLFQQTTRGINRGLNPDQLVREIQVPTSLQDVDCLFPAYIDPEFIIRGIYRGLMGWWADDAAELHPPAPEEYHGVIVQGFGGADAVVVSAELAYNEKKYNLAAKLLSSVLAVEPDHEGARMLKAQALRRMAQATQTGIQSRNFLLTEALALEGRIDTSKPPKGGGLATPDLDMVLKTPPGTHIRMLENAIDPQSLRGVNTVLAIVYTDLEQSFGLALRDGAGEFLAPAPEQVDVQLALPRTVWAEIVLGRLSVSQAITRKRAIVSGDTVVFEQIKQAFAEAWGES